MKRVGLAVCALFVVTCGTVLGQSRPHSGFILDKTSTISSRDKQQINQTCKRVHERTSGEILVCVIRTTRGQNPRQFATNLFNRWGIGDQFEDDGVLVFVAMQDRKAEIILGDGIGSRREETIARTVMSDFMMPKFKQGKPSEGIRIAVDECAKRFFAIEDKAVQLGSPVEDQAVNQASSIVETAAEVNTVAESPITPAIVAEEPFSNATLNDMTASIEVANTAVDIPVEAEAHGPFQKRAQPRRRGGGMGLRLMVLLTGGLGVGGAGLGVYHLATRRRRPRNCQHCGQPMILLDEASDDAHLESGEQLEERLRSVDYDVWVCPACDHALKLRYGKFFSRYRNCVGCGVKASSSTSRTVRSATTMMTGLREVETTCTHCGYHDVTQHVIPMVTETRHSSNFSSGSSSFGSGGGSFGGGGGTSSGGGASGSW